MEWRIGPTDSFEDPYLLGDWELIDLETDPLELHNVIDDPAYRETRDRLYAPQFTTRSSEGGVT